ncbi:uncharacterized protein LOC113331829 [Papaver somniferum]|uniref:uncharacterized protein LOC113331829 n=1 Tax=Papaver somniferum TaxID=3469 RepID=UPI000E6F96A3|nr:uncharacterized protein LOC113331829 [Papaver somniferum]
MGYELFVAVGRCKKHPQHRQSPGVCSCCLREKLSYVVNINNNFTATNSTASSLFWSSSSSHIPSPTHSQQQQQQQEEQASTSLEVISGQKLSTNITRNGVKKDEQEFKRSRSMEVIIRKKYVDDDEVIVEDDRRFNKKKFGPGFWLRLLNKPTPSTNKRNDKMSMMMHSKTMTEKRTQRV